MAIVVITGCSTGIGYEAALRFGRLGNRVYATMRNLAKAGALRDAAAAEGLDVRVVQLDVDSQQSIDQAIAHILREEDHIDVLVNNAGVTGVGPIETTTDEEWHSVFETNFFGPLRVIRAVVPGMRARQSGAIINVSSAAGRLVAPVYGQYHSSKWALECATETLAIELKQFGIRVAAVEPGFFVTPILDKALDAWSERDPSPYEDIERRMKDLYAAAGQNGGDPAVVAAVIEEAVTTNEPKLRWLVGDDAVGFVEGRAKLPDEEYQVLGEKMTDEEWWAKFFEFFPPPVQA
ncbi:MAG: SDR family oxidoreductase [Dehalococcoidia bacterium]